MTDKDLKPFYDELAKKIEEAQHYIKGIEVYANEHGLVCSMMNKTYYPTSKVENIDPNYVPFYIADCSDDNEKEEFKNLYQNRYAGRWMSSTDECTVW